MNYRRLRLIHSLPPLPSAFVKSSRSMEPSLQPSNSPEAPPSNPTNEFTIASFVLAVIFFALFALYLRFFSNRRQPQAPSSGKGVDRSTVLSLPVYDYNGAAKYQIDCAICLGEFSGNEAVKLIPFCKHLFHAECIDTWLFSHASCPVCRSTRLFDADKDVTSSGSGVVKEDGRPGKRDGGERSTLDDTCINIGSFGNGMRRISSCANFTGPASSSLPRTCSF